jgi:uncharacterized protein (TIGR02246 family)
MAMPMLATALFLAVSVVQSQDAGRPSADVVRSPADAVQIDWSRVADRDADLAAVRGEYVAAINAHDATGVSAMYTADALALFGDGELVRGRAAVIQRLQAGAAASTATITLTPARFSASQETGWETGTFTIRPADGGAASEGVYVAIYSRGDDQRWRIAMEVRTAGRALPPVVW